MAPDDPPPVCEHTGKVTHPSRRVAAENLHRVLRNLDGAGRDRRERGRLVVYRCEACSGWHLGNHDPFVIRAQKRTRPRRRGDQEAA